MTRYLMLDSFLFAGRTTAMPRRVYGLKHVRGKTTTVVVCSTRPRPGLVLVFGRDMEGLGTLVLDARIGRWTVRDHRGLHHVRIVPWGEHYGARSNSLLGDCVRPSVGILGAGSVGGPMALLLAKVGFTVALVDGEKVAIENIERTPYTACQVGMPKVHALAEIAIASNPYADVVPIRAEYPAVKAREEWRPWSFDLLVNAASDAVGFALAADFHRDVPIVFPGLHANAASGEIFVSGGLKEAARACFACFRRRVPRDASTQRSPNYGAAAGELAAEPGLGADILHVVSAAASIAIHIATHQAAKSVSFEQQLLLFSHRRNGLLPGAFDSAWASVARDPDCPNHEDTPVPSVDVCEVLAGLPEAEH